MSQRHRSDLHDRAAAPEVDDRLDRMDADLRRSRWLAPLYGGLPQVPVRDTLPTASADFAYRLMVHRAGSGTEDVVYICVLSAAGTYEWAQVATGTP